ncbi:MAG TPA: gliding motility-associated C-terminal domain-containing protein [Puia sp.]|nr:gliding motility-associated C-terminal domain-containing protein [Puia sp.]
MTPRSFRLLYLILISLSALSKGYGQTAQTPAPGCNAPYYKGSYSPPLDGNFSLLSTAVAPDATIYLGCLNESLYSILKIDSLGNMIRSRSYTPSGLGASAGAGKTILDQDGNLFSVMSNSFICRTDTTGNVLSGKKISANDGSAFTLEDLSMLANGDKVFVLSNTVGGLQCAYLVVTSPDGATIKWTKYFCSYNYIHARVLADGDKIILGVGISQFTLAPEGTALVELDGATGTILHQQWFSQFLIINQISRYNNGYIFNGMATTPAAAFYIRTDASLNILAVNDFPNYTVGYPMIFQAQPDGSLYGFYSSTGSMTLFLISPDDKIQWASGVFGFYQYPVAMILDPSGIFIGTEWSATDVITGGPLSAVQLYKSSYSGYFPPCSYIPGPATMDMTPYPLTPINPFRDLRDTTSFNISDYTILESNGPTLVGSTCTGTPVCTTLRITGNPTICTGSGTFTGVTNGDCSPLSWSVTEGPGTAAIDLLPNNAVSIHFSQDGAYKLKALVNNNCSIFGDSIIVHVSMGTPLSLGKDTILCAGDTLRLHAGNGFSSYAWQDGSTDSTFLVQFQGQYTVTAQDYCGNSLNSSIEVSYRLPLASPFPANAAKCLADTLSFPLPTGFDSTYFLLPPVDARIYNDTLQFFNRTTSTFSLQERDSHGCKVNSDIAVQVYPQPDLHIGNDTTICPGDSIHLDAGSGFDKIQWSTGSRDQTIWAGRQATYWVQTTAANGCITRDSITLTTYPAPVVDLDHDTVLCAGATRQLSAGSQFASYRWNDGSAASTRTVDATGQYWVHVTDDHGCSTADTVTIKSIVPLPAGFLPGDTSICQYSSITLLPHGKFNSYWWSDGSTSSSLAVHAPGMYYLQVMDKYGCIGKDSVFLTGKQCLVGFFMPNAFSPNNDGKNDLLRPLVYGNVVKYKFAVYDRWGQLVFESAELLKGWDGTIRGVPQPTGAYAWYCMYQLQGEEIQIQRGAALLIR